MRFSEALALTPKDFDFAHQTLSINKTWDYKGSGGFMPTKNNSSVRKIQIDWQTVVQFSELIRLLPEDKPIFASKGRVYNSTVNGILERHCVRLGLPVLSIHGLRHTFATIFLSFLLRFYSYFIVILTFFLYYDIIYAKYYFKNSYLASISYFVFSIT